MTRRKTSFSISSPSSKLTISHILYTVIILGYNTIINRSSKWFVSTCGMKANSPLTTRISDIFSSPVRQPSCGNFHVILLRYHASMQPRLHSTKISRFKTFTPWRSNYWLQRLKVRPQFWCAKFWTLGRPNFVCLAWFHVNETSKRTSLPRSKICPVPCERSLKIMKLSANYRCMKIIDWLLTLSILIEVHSLKLRSTRSAESFKSDQATLHSTSAEAKQYKVYKLKRGYDKKDEMETNDTKNTGHLRGRKRGNQGDTIQLLSPHWRPLVTKWFASCLLDCVEIKNQIELCASLHLLYVIVNVLSSLLFVICLSFDFKCLVKPCQEV